MTKRNPPDGDQIKVNQVLIVDDHPAMRTGVGVLIGREVDFKICGEAGTVEDACLQVAALEPDVIVLDLTLDKESSLAHFDRLREGRPGLKILVMSMHDELVHGVRALCQGKSSANGYIQKDVSPEQIIVALRTVMGGGLAASPQLAKVLAGMAGGKKAPRAKGNPDLLVLSPREFEVYELIGLGLPTRDIAARLGISPRTVEAHKENIKKKLGLGSAAELAMHAAQSMQGIPPQAEEREGAEDEEGKA